MFYSIIHSITYSTLYYILFKYLLCSIDKFVILRQPYHNSKYWRKPSRHFTEIKSDIIFLSDVWFAETRIQTVFQIQYRIGTYDCDLIDLKICEKRLSATADAFDRFLCDHNRLYNLMW